MPASESRNRSRSPRRTKTHEPGISKGLKWKEKKSSSDRPDDPNAGRDRYRDRADDSRPPIRQPATESEASRTKPPPKDTSNSKDADTDDVLNTRSKFGSRASTAKSVVSSTTLADHEPDHSRSDTPSTAPKKPKTSKPAAPTGPMILVTVNDRLGTKAQIPCMASDPVKAFKMMVAARIGRQPHEIMLKRQGERPFKDQLTLEDYGVSNGVQLDLELDTGD